MVQDSNQGSSKQPDASNSPRQAKPDPGPKNMLVTPGGMRYPGPGAEPARPAGKNPIIINEDKGRA